jgi:hypothetical protein
VSTRGAAEYAAVSVLADLVPTRVLVSLGVAFAFVALVVIAGVLLRDRHPTRPRPAPVTTTRARPADVTTPR